MKLQKVYSTLPYPAKTLAANFWGYYLRWWRYGNGTEDLVNEALERESWTAEKLRNWQDNKLAQVLTLAATQVPYYQDQWQKRRQKGDKCSWELLENWLVLNKQEIREKPELFLSGRKNRLYIEHTSGSTGTPLTLFQSRYTLRQWYALNEARVHRWNNVTLKDRWAIIGGRTIIPFSQNTPPFWIWNQALKQLYLSSFHISEKNAPVYFSAIQEYKIRYILGYPSSLTVLAEFASSQNIEIPQLEVVICNAEPLFDYQRSIISKSFNCPVVNTYGMSELVFGASECQKGEMHLWPDAGIVEIMDDSTDEKLTPNNTGRIIATGLLNLDMPLIRYDTGDRGSIKSGECPCGRHLPMLNEIEGRSDDLIVTSDGRKIGRLDPIFKADIPIREAQIVQEAVNRIRVIFVPANGYAHDAQLLARLKEHLGQMEFILEKVESIPKGPNGKLKAVISKINK